MKRLSALAAACVLALAGCGGTSHQAAKTATSHTTIPAPAPITTSRCIPGSSFMGCSVAPNAGITPRGEHAPSGAAFPDVSSFQGHPDWATAKPHIAGAVVKEGEFTEDPDFAWNVAELKRLKVPFGVYWFVRPTGCAHEGAQIVKYARAVGGVTTIVLDEEVPGIAGYAGCLDPYVRSVTGRAAVVYRSASNNFDATGDGLACWVAAYGPSSAPACNGRAVAWQYTDGRFGFPAAIPGIQNGDVSLNLGLFPAPGPVDLGGAQHYERYPNVRWSSTHSGERTTVETWDHAQCEDPARRSVCQTSAAHLRLLLGRDQVLYHRDSKALRNELRLPGRIQGLVHRLDGRGHVTHWL